MALKEVAIKRIQLIGIAPAPDQPLNDLQSLRIIGDLTTRRKRDLIPSERLQRLAQRPFAIDVPN